MPSLLRRYKARRVLGENHIHVLKTLYDLGCIAALRGERDKALDYLQEAAERGFRQGDLMAADPDLESLHGDPEVEALVEKVRESV